MAHPKGSAGGGGRSAGGAVAAQPQRSFASPATTFDAMKRRWDRTRPENSGLTNNVDDRTAAVYGGWSSKVSAAMSTRGRALKVYRSQAARPLHELTQAQARAPFGRFSTISNPAPARAFPSQAPNRTKKGELVARAARLAAKKRKA